MTEAMFLRCLDDILRIACAIPFPKVHLFSCDLGKSSFWRIMRMGDSPRFTFLHDSLFSPLLRYNRRSVKVIPISDLLSQFSDWTFIATHPVFIRSRQFTCWLLLSQNWKPEIRPVTWTPTFPSKNLQDHIIRFRKWISTEIKLIKCLYVLYLY